MPARRPIRLGEDSDHPRRRRRILSRAEKGQQACNGEGGGSHEDDPRITILH
jgi:hypothetical protein